MASTAIRFKVVVMLLFYSLFIDAPIFMGNFVLGLYFVRQYFVSFLVLQSSCWGRERWLLYFNRLVNVMWML